MKKIAIRNVFFRFLTFSLLILTGVIGFGCVGQSSSAEETPFTEIEEIQLLTPTVQINIPAQNPALPTATEKIDVATTVVSTPPTLVTPQFMESTQLFEKVGEIDILGGGPIAISEDGSTLAISGLAADRNEYIYLVDMGTGDTVAAYEKPFSALTGTRSLAFSSQGNYLAAGGNQQFVYVWDIDIGSLVFELPYQDDAALSVDFSQDGGHLAAGSAGEMGGVIIWNLLDGSVLEIPISVLASDVKFMPDHSTLAVATIWYEDETLPYNAVLLWNFKEGTFESVFPGENASSLAISNDGKLLAAAVDGHLRLWDIQESKEIEVLENTVSERVVRIDWSSQGVIAALNSNKSIALWDKDGELITYIRDEGAEDILFDSENNLIVSAFNKPLQIFAIFPRD